MSSELYIEVKKGEGLMPVSILYLKGPLDVNTQNGLVIKAAELVNSGASNVVIDLKDVDYMGSVGIRAINTVSKSLMKKGGKLGLSNSSGSSARIMKTLGFDSYFNVYDTAESAVNEF